MRNLTNNLSPLGTAITIALGIIVGLGAYLSRPAAATVYAYGEEVYEVEEDDNGMVFSNDNHSLDEYGYILVTSEKPVTIYLKNWSRINYGDEQAPIEVDTDANVTIIYEGENDLDGRFGTYPGIEKDDDDNTLYIEAANKDAKLIARGGKHAAGIGTDDYDDCENLYIQGGTVEAYGKQGGAGIGSGSKGDAYNITIDNCTVHATGDWGGAGIGSGYCFSGEAENIRIINNSIVTANTGNNAEAGGIGGGSGCDANNISIKDSTVTVKNTFKGACIGGGLYGDANNITIKNSTIDAQGSSTGAAIGAGSAGSAYHITIDNCTVTTSSNGWGAAAIGAGTESDSSGGGEAKNITIRDSYVCACSRGLGTCIGAGEGDIGENIYIENCVLYLRNNANKTGPAIGSAYGEKAPSDFTLRNCLIEYEFAKSKPFDNLSNYCSKNMFINHNTADVSGNVTLRSKYHPWVSTTLTIPEDSSLTITKKGLLYLDVDLVNNGTLNLYDENSLTFENNHKLTNNSKLTYEIEPTTDEDQDSDAAEAESTQNNSPADTATGDSTATASGDSAAATGSVFSQGQTLAVIAVLAACAAALGIFIAYRKKHS